METLTIRIKKNKALKLIRDLEDLDLIQVLSPVVQKDNVKFSDLLTGSISADDADRIQKELQTMRNEWERSTC